MSCKKQKDGLSSSSPCDLAILSNAIANSVNKDTISIENKIELLEEAIEMVKNCKLGFYKDTIADAYRKIGNAIWSEDYVKARKYYRKGINLHPSGIVLGKLYSNYGLTHYNERDYYSALAYFDTALFVKPIYIDSPYYFNATKYLGDSYLKLGQPNIAEEYFERALEFANRQKDTSTISEMSEAMSNCKRKLKDNKAAISIGNSGISLLMKHTEKSFDDSLTLANCFLNVGNAWQDSLLFCAKQSIAWKQTGDSAVLYYSKAKILYERLKLLENQLTLMSNLGELFRRLGQTKAAQKILNEAIRVLDDDSEMDLNKRLQLAGIHINLGETLMDVGILDNAGKHFDLALRYIAHTFSPISSTLIPRLDELIASPSSAILAIKNKAILALKKGQASDGHISIPAMKSSLNIYDNLSEFVDSRRKGYLTESDKIALNQEVRPLFDNATSLCLELEKQTLHNKYLKKAFLYSERSKSTVLLEMLQSNASRKKFNQELKNVEELQKDILADDQALLSYHGMDSFLFVFLLTKDTLLVQQVPINQLFYQDVINVNNLLENNSRINTKVEDYFCSSSKRIYDKLFPEFGIPLPKRLIIVPNDALQSLSFEALWTSKDTGYLDWKKRKNYLLYQHTISYAPSANLLWEMRTKKRIKSRSISLVAFAPVFPKHLAVGDDQSLPDTLAKLIKFLKPLPNTQEINKIKRVVSTISFKKTNATKENFWTACKTHTVIHISTHGVLNGVDSRFNFISFSQLKNKVNLSEFLFMKELYSRDLNLDMVILPACETSRGTQISGEGNISMARGLAAAGVNSFVTTMWKMNAHATIDIMPLFYQELIKNNQTPKDIAMCNAKKEYIEKGPNYINPSDWACPILTGNTDNIELKPAKHFSFYPYLFLLAILLVLVVSRRKILTQFN